MLQLFYFFRVVPDTGCYKQIKGSRLTAFLNEEKSFLKPLPASPYELAVWSSATIQSDYLISDGKNKYSVPFDLIGEEVDLRITTNTLEAFFHGARVASYPRLQEKQREPIIKVEHMPTNHKKYLAYNSDSFIQWAESTGTNTTVVVKAFLTAGKVAEQGYKSCASLTKLADKYGHNRLEDACTRALAYTPSPSIKNISTILKSGQDKVNEDTKTINTSSGSQYGFTRGAAYFGGKRND